MLSQKHSKIQGCDTSKVVGEDYCLDKQWDNPYPDDFISEKTVLEDEIAPGLLHDQICCLLVHDARESICVACTFWVFSLILYIFVHNNFPCHTCCCSLIASEVKESVEPKSTLCIHGVINNESSQACMRPVYQQGYKTSGLFTSLSIFLWQGICFIMSLSAFPWAGESYVCAQVGNE